MKPIIKILESYSYNTIEQAGNELIVVDDGDFHQIAEDITALYEQQDTWEHTFPCCNGKNKVVGEDVFTIEDIQYIEKSGYENYLQYQIAVMEWNLRGGEVELFDCEDWYDVVCAKYDWSNIYYRAVPKQKEKQYRPYEEVNPEWVGKAVIFKETREQRFITNINGTTIIISRRSSVIESLQTFFERYTWLDGSPCGEV